MSTAAIVVCTTLIVNVGHGSVVTRECRAEEPQVVVVSPASVPAAADFTKNRQLDFTVTQEDLPAEKPTQPAAVEPPQPAPPSVAMLPPPKQPVIAVAPKPKLATATARPVKIKRTIRARTAKYTPHRKYRKSSHQVEVVTAVYDAPVQPKKSSFWEKLKKVPQRGLLPLFQ